MLVYRLGHWTHDRGVAGSTLGHSTFMTSPSVNCSQTCVFVTTEYNLVLVWAKSSALSNCLEAVCKKSGVSGETLHELSQ